MQKKNFLMTVLGTHGDLNPSLGIALELVRRGHSVTIATSDLYREKIEHFGLQYLELRPSMADVESAGDWKKKAIHPRRSLEFMLRKFIMPYVEANYLALESIVQDYDVLISHSITYATPLLAEKFKKPWAAIVMQPLAFFSAFDPPVIAHYPALLILWKYLPRAGIRFVLSALQNVVKIWAKPAIRVRKKIGLSESGKNPVFSGQYSPYLNLALFSPLLAKPQPDWPAHTELTGFALFDQEKAQELSPALQEFLAVGDAPLVFTLGTIAVQDARDFYKIAASVALKLKKRAVLLTGHEPKNLEGLPKSDQIFISAYEPYSKIFPHACALIHQGGAGTIAHSLYAGRPQVIVPFANDQFDNAARMERLGVAKELPRENLQEGLEASLLAVFGASFQEKALAAKQAIEKENGIKTACNLLEQLAAR